MRMQFREKINVLYEDNHLLVAEKPVNMLSQGDATGDTDLLSVLKDYIKENTASRAMSIWGLFTGWTVRWAV